MNCWASCIGGCGGGQSKEHFISKSIFSEKEIRVFGLPWCKAAPVSIGLGSAVAKILCQAHNNALSSYDSEAQKLSAFLTTSILERPESEEELQVNGRLLEMWALKTMLNLGYLGVLVPNKVQAPPPSLVEQLFAGRSFSEGAGLYFISGKISNETFENGFSWNAIENYGREDKPVVGMTFTFNGVHFALIPIPVQAEKYLRDTGSVRGVDYQSASIRYHPQNITLQSQTGGTKKLILCWK